MGVMSQRCVSGSQASTSRCLGVAQHFACTHVRYKGSSLIHRELKHKLSKSNPSWQVQAVLSTDSSTEAQFDGFDESQDSAALNGCCYGCGIKLQTKDADLAGYVPLDKYQLKNKHGQKDQLFCSRCHALSHGAMIPAVEDFSQRDKSATLELNGKRLISPEELREQLRDLGSKRVLVVLLVDLLDASGSFMSKVRELVGRNPILVLGTKADLLPSGTKPAAVVEWLLATAAHKRLNAMGVHLISSRTGEGLPAAVAQIRLHRKGRDVYVMGAANVGKSAFVRALIREMKSYTSAQYDPAAAAAAKRLPVESAMPGTTLSIIPLRTFASGGTLYDTPGVHLHHRLPHLLSPQELKEIHPRRKLKPYIAPTPKAICAAYAEEEEQEEEEGTADEGSGGSTTKDVDLLDSHAVAELFADEEDWRGPATHSVSASYLWGAIARIDVLACPRATHFVFYGPPSVLVESTPLLGVEDRVETEEGEHLFGQISVEGRGGMRRAKEVTLDAVGTRTAIADVALSGFPGWVGVYAPNDYGAIKLRIWAPKGVEVFVRPPLPVPSPL